MKTNAWLTLNTARYWHTAMLLPNGKALIAGGDGGSSLTNAKLYDPANGSGAFSLTETNAPLFPMRFYRVLSP